MLMADGQLLKPPRPWERIPSPADRTGVTKMRGDRSSFGGLHLAVYGTKICRDSETCISECG